MDWFESRVSNSVGVCINVDMVDCDLFTDFNKELTIESGRILL